MTRFWTPKRSTNSPGRTESVKAYQETPPPAPPRSGEGRKIDFSPLPASGWGRGRGFRMVSRAKENPNSREPPPLRLRLTHTPSRRSRFLGKFRLVGAYESVIM